MSTRELLQIIITKQDSFQEGQVTMQQRLERMEFRQDEFQQELAKMREEMKRGFKETHDRLDRQGRQLAYLEDDSPTREEHDRLVKGLRE